ncbi:winged helix-turn-helix domain-containing protein [Shimia sp. NS0008-38b]|uniref:ArsR/SmtB family transcription factor n=1 Tax=Shimia sp. NS0008-38b TaxID=3127653 RepID=UPI003104EBFF
MKSGPDIARIASLIGDPARANVLTALMSGKALTATELANEAGVMPQTVSSHLSRLEAGKLIVSRKSGRHKYYTLADDEVAMVLETLMGFAAHVGHLRTRTGPKEVALRKARVCYNHLAGDMGVQMYQSMTAGGFLMKNDGTLSLTEEGRWFLAAMNLDVSTLPKSRAPMCRECLDWSERKSHLAGKLGRALLSHFLESGWACRVSDSRIVEFTASGERKFSKLFG